MAKHIHQLSAIEVIPLHLLYTTRNTEAKEVSDIGPLRRDTAGKTEKKKKISFEPVQTKHVLSIGEEENV